MRKLTYWARSAADKRVRYSQANPCYAMLKSLLCYVMLNEFEGLTTFMLKSPAIRNSVVDSGVIAAMERRLVNSCKKTDGGPEYGEVERDQ